MTWRRWKKRLPMRSPRRSILPKRGAGNRSKSSLALSTRRGRPMAANSKTVTMTYREAVRAAIRDALVRDERVFLMGEDVGRYGGCFAVSKGLLDEFGP